MKENESKVFVGIRILMAVFILILVIGINSSRVQEAMAPYLVLNIIGIFVARFIAVNYERGKRWARIWMLIANYGSILLLFKDIGDFSKLTSSSRFSGWAEFGILIEAVCIIASIYVLVQVHKKKSEFETKREVSTSTNPEQTLEKLKNMLDKGIITHEEYETKKKEVLNRI